MHWQRNFIRFGAVVWVGALVTFLASGGALPVAAKDRFPYKVYTVADETPVLSGPGEAFYATDLLPEGTPLEVYRREPGGWLAIRPPERSFSWVPARKLLVAAGDRMATIVADDAVAWIGSRVETVQDHRWQVTLERGERVVVLGHRDLADEQKGTTETWYQIAPPAGEFRWIHADDVARRPSPPEAAVASSEVSPATADENADQENPRATAADASVRRADLTTTRSRRSETIEPAQYRAEWTPRSTPRQARRLEPATDSSVPLPTSSPATDRELEDITLQMTLLAQREPNLWNLAPLRARTEALIERGSNPLERGKARLMLEKIEEFEELQQRHIRTERGVAVAPADTGVGAGSAGPIGAGLSALNFVSTGNPLSSAAASSSATPSRSSPNIEPRFDGTGWLLPVHSTKRVAPPYALLDDNGKVLQYVTPSPGLNLHRYERKRVGIYGQKGASQLLNAPHLTAHRVVDLDRHAKRP